MMVLFIGLALVNQACKKTNNEDAENESLPLELTLLWYQSDAETQEEFETGLRWCFSYLGAELPTGSWDKSVEWKNSQEVVIHFEELGFNSAALIAIAKLNTSLMNSGEYHQKNGIDAGRWVVNAFNNAQHYYAIVDMPKHLRDFNSNAEYWPTEAAIVESAIAFGERLISIGTSKNINDIVYISKEISGSIISGNFRTEEFEVLDVMQNGQLRFGVYSSSGDLISGGDPRLSEAGKPAKCLWCHEVVVQPAFSAITTVPGYYTPRDFDTIVGDANTSLETYRLGLETDFNFRETQGHTELEKLYIRYMEPSAKRLAAEWGYSMELTLEKLQHTSNHIHDEFPEMGELYLRNEIIGMQPFNSVESTFELRETDANEVNLIFK